MKVKKTARGGVSALQMIARVISRSYRVTVVNGIPRTDGKTIWVPMINPSDLEGPGTAAEKARVIHGYLDHEAGHVLFTPMDELTRSIQDRKNGAMPCAYPKIFQGVVNILEDIRMERNMIRQYPGSRANMAITARNAFHEEDPIGTDGWAILLNRLVRDLRRDVLKQDCPVSDETKAATESILSGGYAEVYRLAARQYDSLSAVIAGADEVLAKIKELAPKQEDGDGIQEGHDMAQIIRSRMSECSGSDEDALIPQEDETGVPFPGTASAIGATATRMRALLEDRTQCRNEAALGGRINRRALHRPSVGNPYVFSRRTGDDVGINANVVILLDRSGSMGGKPAEMLAQTGYVVTRTLETIGVSVAVLAFGEYDGTTLVKDWWQPTRFERFSPIAVGGTPIDTALGWGRAFLSAPPSEDGRRIVITITDGAPNDIVATLQRAREIVRDGGQCLFLGILVPREGFVETFRGFPAEVVTKLEDLPQAMGRIAIEAISSRAA